MSKRTEIRIRHWVFIDETKFFGHGRYELLEHIAETGSISKAATAMELSYKKAWAMVDAMNTLGSSPYVLQADGRFSHSKQNFPTWGSSDFREAGRNFFVNLVFSHL